MIRVGAMQMYASVRAISCVLYMCRVARKRLKRNARDAAGNAEDRDKNRALQLITPWWLDNGVSLMDCLE